MLLLLRPLKACRLLLPLLLFLLLMLLLQLQFPLLLLLFLTHRCQLKVLSAQALLLLRQEQQLILHLPRVTNQLRDYRRLLLQVLFPRLMLLLRTASTLQLLLAAHLPLSNPCLPIPQKLSRGALLLLLLLLQLVAATRRRHLKTTFQPAMPFPRLLLPRPAAATAIRTVLRAMLLSIACSMILAQR
jgi:hypothetical protein